MKAESKKFEYSFETIDCLRRDKDTILLEKINLLGNNGWEIVTFVDEYNDYHRMRFNMLLKREITKEVITIDGEELIYFMRDIQGKIIQENDVVRIHCNFLNIKFPNALEIATGTNTLALAELGVPQLIYGMKKSAFSIGDYIASPTFLGKIEDEEQLKLISSSMKYLVKCHKVVKTNDVKINLPYFEDDELKKIVTLYNCNSLEMIR